MSNFDKIFQMTQMVDRVKSISETKRIKKALKKQQQQAAEIQSLQPEQQIVSPDAPPAGPINHDYRTQFNLRDLKIVLSPIQFINNGTGVLIRRDQ